jgi:hypothetical protein
MGLIHSTANSPNFDAIIKHHPYFSDTGIKSSLLNQQQLKLRLVTNHFGLGF